MPKLGGFLCSSNLAADADDPATTRLDNGQKCVH